MTNHWWKDSRGPFHFEDDWGYAANIDKVGHLVGGYYVSYFTGEGLMLCGFNWRDATIYGALFGFVYETIVEIEDGYSARWGFSFSDLIADVLGRAFYIGQYYYPFLQNFTFKYMYHSKTMWSDLRDSPGLLLSNHDANSFWIATNVYNILPRNFRKFWFSGINLTFGFQIEGIDGVRHEAYGPIKRHYLIGLEYDLMQLSNDKYGGWNWILQNLNFLKQPGPIIDMGPSTRLRSIYPFQ